jgi:hypothetical protein
LHSMISLNNRWQDITWSLNMTKVMKLQTKGLYKVYFVGEYILGWYNSPL